MNDHLFPPDIVPIPLRSDFTVRVHIPLDLTEAEARKIGNVMLAYASAIETQQNDVEHENAIAIPTTQKGSDNA
jgi:hypothetical protein